MAFSTPAVIGEILGSSAKLRPAERGQRKRVQTISPKIKFLANILFLLNSNKTRVSSTGYSLGLEPFNFGVQRDENRLNSCNKQYNHKHNVFFFY